MLIFGGGQGGCCGRDHGCVAGSTPESAAAPSASDPLGIRRIDEVPRRHIAREEAAERPSKLLTHPAVDEKVERVADEYEEIDKQTRRIARVFLQDLEI